MEGVQIELTGADAAIARLSQAEAALANPLDMYQAIGEAMVTSTRQRFDDSAGPDGSPWPISLRAQFEGGKTLVDKAVLVGSITHIAAADQVEWGTNLDYAATHQFGATITPKSADALKFSIPGIGFITSQSVTIPARPFIGLNDEDETKIERIADDFLAQALGEIGRAN